MKLCTKAYFCPRHTKNTIIMCIAEGKLHKSGDSFARHTLFEQKTCVANMKTGRMVHL